MAAESRETGRRRPRQAEELTALLEKAKSSLPADIAAKSEHILIAACPQRVLTPSIRRARADAAAARVDLEAQGLVQEAATQAYLDATAPGELLQETVDPAALEARSKLEQATGGYKTAREHNTAMQEQQDLAVRTREETRRLGLVPSTIVAISTAALLGGAAYHNEQVAHDRAQEIIASGTVQPGTEQSRELETLAGNVPNAILELTTEAGALAVGLGTYWATRDRLARPRARGIVRRAKRKASNPPV